MEKKNFATFSWHVLRHITVLGFIYCTYSPAAQPAIKHAKYEIHSKNMPNYTGAEIEEAKKILENFKKGSGRNLLTSGCRDPKGLYQNQGNRSQDFNCAESLIISSIGECSCELASPKTRDTLTATLISFLKLHEHEITKAVPFNITSIGSGALFSEFSIINQIILNTNIRKFKINLIDFVYNDIFKYLEGKMNKIGNEFVIEAANLNSARIFFNDKFKDIPISDRKKIINQLSQELYKKITSRQDDALEWWLSNVTWPGREHPLIGSNCRNSIKEFAQWFGNMPKIFDDLKDVEVDIVIWKNSEDYRKECSHTDGWNSLLMIDLNGVKEDARLLAKLLPCMDRSRNNNIVATLKGGYILAPLNAQGKIIKEETYSSSPEYLQEFLSALEQQ